MKTRGCRVGDENLKHVQTNNLFSFRAVVDNKILNSVDYDVAGERRTRTFIIKRRRHSSQNRMLRRLVAKTLMNSTSEKLIIDRVLQTKTKNGIL